MSEALVTLPETPVEKARNTALIVHACYAGSFVVGLSCIVGVVIAYIKRDEVAGTIYESHLTYAIRTFWIGLGMSVAVFLLCFLLVGFLLLPALGIWFIIRVVRPFLAWNDRQPILKPDRFF